MIVIGNDPGSVHHALGAIAITRDKCYAVDAGMLSEDPAGGPSREAISRFIKAQAEEHGVALWEIVVVVEKPSGVAYGKDVAAIKGRSKHLLATACAAERVASIAHGLGCIVVEHAAVEVRGGLCLNAQAKDPIVRTIVRSNVLHAPAGVHIQDALAIALFEGARRTGYQIRRDVTFLKAVAKQAENKKGRAARKKSARIAGAATALALETKYLGASKRVRIGKRLVTT